MSPSPSKLQKSTTTPSSGNESLILPLLSKWRRDQLQKDYPGLFAFISQVNEHNVALVVMAFTRLYAGDGQRLNLLSTVLGQTEEFFPSGEKNDEDFLWQLQRQLGDAHQLPISANVVAGLELVRILIIGAFALSKSAVVLEIFQKFKENFMAKPSEECQKKVKELEATLFTISTQSTEIEAEWETLKKEVDSGSCKRSTFKKFEIKVEKLNQQADEALAEVGRLEVEIDGKIETLDNSVKTKVAVGVGGTAISAACVASIGTNPRMETTADKIILGGKVLGALISGIAALWSFGSAVVVDRKELEALRKQLEEVKEMHCNLKIFCDKIGAIRMWTVERCDEVEEMMMMGEDEVEGFGRRWTEGRQVILQEA